MGRKTTLPNFILWITFFICTAAFIHLATDFSFIERVLLATAINAVAIKYFD